ncbi:MAG: fatty acid desaturase family protein [Panacagrimonas sp.]
MEMPTKISDWLSREEIAQFTQRSDWHAGRVLLLNWAMIAATFWMVSVWTNPVTIIVAVILLGGRQMGLAGLMHEAGHKTFFKTQALNRWLGQWLCAYPILGDCDAYGASHREHHKMAGTDADPDLPNYRSYPVSKASFRRKVIRDLTGQTGIRNLRGIFFGRSRNMMMRDGEHYPAGKGLLANLVLLGVLVAFGVGELYLLWVLAYITTYSLVARLRQVAEHGAVAGLFDPDPRRHTRTILANPLECLLICPNHLNYHAEHHFAASVPGYRLKDFHRKLVAKGFYDQHPQTLTKGYWEVLKQAVPEFDPATAPLAT